MKYQHLESIIGGKGKNRNIRVYFHTDTLPTYKRDYQTVTVRFIGPVPGYLPEKYKGEGAISIAKHIHVPATFYQSSTPTIEF